LIKTRRKGFVRGLKLLLIILAGFFLYYNFYLKNNDYQSSSDALIGGNFELVGEYGKIYTHDDFLGKPLLIFFGFASCPDICPYGLSVMGSVLDDLEKKNNKFNVVFVTLDPERDNPDKLAEFVKLFHPNIIGLSGNSHQINSIANNWRVYRKEVELSGSALGYSIDHSAYIYLMNKDGKYLTHFSHNVDAEEIIKELEKFI